VQDYTDKASQLADKLHISGDRALGVLYGLERKYGKGLSADLLITSAVFDIARQQLTKEFAWISTGNQNATV
jgi:hypothetical protein